MGSRSRRKSEDVIKRESFGIKKTFFSVNCDFTGFRLLVYMAANCDFRCYERKHIL